MPPCHALRVAIVPDSLFVFGASGHAKVVIDVARRCGLDVNWLLDDDPTRHGSTILGVPVVGGREVLETFSRNAVQGIVAVGANEARIRIARWLQHIGFSLATLIDPASIVSSTATVGAGTVVMPGAVINAEARIADHVIINTAATIDHDCVIEEGAHVAPGSHLCGNVHVGRAAMIGAGSVVIPSVNVGNGATIGAGSTLLKDVPEHVRAAGCPCRILKAGK